MSVEQQVKDTNYVYGVPQDEASRQAAIASIEAEKQRVQAEQRSRAESAKKEIERLDTEIARQTNREYGYYESELTRENRLFELQREKQKYQRIASSPGDSNESRYVTLLSEREAVLKRNLSAEQMEQEKRQRMQGLNKEAPRVPGDAGRATRAAQGIAENTPSYYDINKERPEGGIVSNILHGDNYVIGGYRSPKTGKVYESQEEAYRQGAAPEPPKQYFVGLTENISTRSGNDPKRYFVGLTETISTSKAPEAFAVSLSEGAPKKPRELTQAEVDAMTPQQLAVHNADVAAWNKYVDQQEVLFKQAKQQNVLQWKQSKSELLFDIAELKRKGVTVLSAQTTEGPRDIPINNAFKALTSGKIGGATITGLGIAPTIPEGFTVTGLTNQTLVPSKELIEKAQREEEQKQTKRILGGDPTGLSKFTYKEEQMAMGVGKSGPLDPNAWERSGSYYYAALGTNIAGLMNIAKAGTGFILEKLGGTKLGVASALGTPTLYQQKIQDPYTLGFNAPLTAAQESIMEGNATQFPVVLNQEAQQALKVAQKAPIGAIVGQGAGFFVTAGAPVPTRFLSIISPIKYTPVISSTGKGAERVATIFTVGYNPKTSKYLGGFLGAEEKYKPFAGTPDWGRMGLERVIPPTRSSFDVYEFAAYNKQQAKPIYDLFRYGEKTGTVKPGTVEQQILENIERAKQGKMKVKYETTLPVQIQGIPLSPREMQSMQQAISVIEKKGYTEPGKGSLIQNMMSGWGRRPQGDLLDLEIKTPKNTEKIMKDVENLRYRAAQAAEKGNYEKQQKLLAKADKREAKIYEKGEAAVDYILSNVKMEPGRALGRKGFNIVVGEAEGIPKVVEQSGLILYHGTNPKSAQRILKQGLSFEKSRTSESTIFSSTDTRGAYGMAGVTLEIRMRPTAKILDVNEKGMGGWDDAAIREHARKNKYDLIKNLMQGQQSFGEEIEIVSAKNILSIKPTKSSIPKTIYDVPTGRYIKNNIRTISGEWINPTAKLERPGIKGQGKEVLNMIGPQEQLTDIIGEALGNVDRPFGEKWPKGTIKFRVKDESGKVVTYKIGYQSMAKFKAISGIQSAESMADDYAHTQEWKDRLLGGAKLVKSPKTYRYEKDPLDAYMLTYRDIKYQYDIGDIAGARESVQTALGMRKYYTGYDFFKGAKTFKSVTDIQVPQQPVRSASEKILSGSNTVTPKALRVSSPLVLTRQERESPYASSVYSSSARLGSVKIESPRSALSARSSRSAFSSSSIKSGGLSGSVKTITSSSAKTSSAELSARSGLSKSGASGKSGLSARPSPSAKSVFGPSPKSVFSPSPRSPGVSPLSVVTPSPISPSSPKSPSLMPRLIPKSQPIPQLKPIGLRVPFLKNRTKKEKTSTKGTEEFFGSTNIASVLGFRSKKKDFDYGKDLSGLAAKNIKTTDPIRKTPMTRGKTRSMLAQPKRYFTPTKKQSNRFLRL